MFCFKVNINRGLLTQRLQEFERVHQTWNERGVNFVDLGLAAPPLPTQIEEIVVKRLIIRPTDSILSDLMVRSRPQLLGEVTVDLLTAGKLNLEKNTINGILLSDVVTSDQIEPIFGQKTFDDLSTSSTTLDTLNGMNFNEFLEEVKRQGDHYEHLDMVGEIFVNDLNVREINGVNWSDFVRNTYRRDKRTTLTGNLVLMNVSHVNNLRTDLLQGRSSDLLMTTTTNQIISSKVILNKFKGHSIKARKINKRKFSDIAVLGEQNTFKTPIKILTIHIDGSLTIESRDDQVSQSLEAIKRHIIGSSPTDLSQIYDGQVMITGSLTLKNVNLEADGQLILADRPVDLKIQQNYWLKNVDQEIPGPFKFLKAVDTVTVTSKLLNNHPTQDLLLLDPPTNWTQAPVNLKFASANVNQNVITNRKSRLNVLDEMAVRRGQSSTIRGPIQFRDEVIIQHLNSRVLNEVPIGLVSQEMKEINFTKSVIVKDLDLTQQSLSVDQSLLIKNYNGVNLEDFLKKVVRIDQPFSLKQLQVDNFASNNLTVGLFENHQFDLLFRQLQREFVDHPPESEEENSPNEKNLRIKGDATFTADIFARTFNGEMNVEDYLELIVDSVDQGETLEIGGEKFFQVL